MLPDLEFLRLAFTWCFWLGIAVIAPRARHFFATAQKSAQKRPSLRLTPLQKDTGVPIDAGRFSYCEKTRKKRSDSFSQKTHDNCVISIACLMWI